MSCCGRSNPDVERKKGWIRSIYQPNLLWGLKSRRTSPNNSTAANNNSAKQQFDLLLNVAKRCCRGAACKETTWSKWQERWSRRQERWQRPLVIYVCLCSGGNGVSTLNNIPYSGIGAPRYKLMLAEWRRHAPLSKMPWMWWPLDYTPKRALRVKRYCKEKSPRGGWGFPLYTKTQKFDAHHLRAVNFGLFKKK